LLDPLLHAAIFEDVIRAVPDLHLHQVFHEDLAGLTLWLVRHASHKYDHRHLREESIDFLKDLLLFLDEGLRVLRVVSLHDLEYG